MQYMVLVYGDRDAWEALTAAERESWLERYRGYMTEAREAGVLLGAERLAHVRDATTVRARDAETFVTDGPYAEVKEALGGYFLFECGSLDEAVEWASRCPAVEYSAVEVRPVHPDPDEVHV